jgi:hypothetical protein
VAVVSADPLGQAELVEEAAEAAESRLEINP